VTTGPQVISIRAGISDDVVRETLRVLRGGGLVVLPTDTVYGLACDPAIPDAIERIYDAKHRERGKPIPLLAAGMAEVESFGAALGAAERRLAQAFWPGPLTLVLRVGAGTEGFRVPDFDVTLRLLRAAGGVLRVTSANHSGEPPALTAEDAVAAIGSRTDLVLDAGRVPGGVASSVVRVSANGLDVLREGALARPSLLAAIDGMGAC
jgi:tRNA threonylcarbamoyl adenosine modification protein (Sua5/YciO/YrdC/YwlC family)